MPRRILVMTAQSTFLVNVSNVSVAEMMFIGRNGYPNGRWLCVAVEQGGMAINVLQNFRVFKSPVA